MRILGVKVETSGFNSSGQIEKNYQIVNMCLIVSDTDDFSVFDSLYVEMQWDGTSKWDKGAEKYHGQSRTKGLETDPALVLVADFMLKYFDINEKITVFAENASTFTLPFLKQFLESNGIHFNFHHRNLEFSSMLWLFTEKTYIEDILITVLNGTPLARNSKHDLLNMFKAVRLCKKSMEMAYA